MEENLGKLLAAGHDTDVEQLKKETLPQRHEDVNESAETEDFVSLYVQRGRGRSPVMILSMAL